MAKYLLVSFKTCPWVQRAAIVLREKNVDFEFRHIEPDNRPDWFLAISPHKKVPVLRVDDRVSLFESNAIADIWTKRFCRGCIPRTRSSAL
jgi:glutathione S-transferase